MSALFLSNPVQAEEQEANSHKGNEQNADPHQNTGNTLGIQIYKKIRIDQGGSGSGDQNGGVELQNGCLDQQEQNVSKGEGNGCEGVIPLSLFPLIEQKPVNNVQTSGSSQLTSMLTPLEFERLLPSTTPSGLVKGRM